MSVDVEQASPVVPGAPKLASQLLERAAAARLTAALRNLSAQHERGVRERFRAEIATIIEQAEQGWAVCQNELALLDIATPLEVTALREPQTERGLGRHHSNERQVAAVAPRLGSTLCRAYAARAEDACHGANQLSLSAQRAPTREACEAGWQKVEAIVRIAERAARDSAEIVVQLEHEGYAVAAASRAARSAEAAAKAARKVIADRNRSYTFHTQSGFSFGEGWYLAAAAVLEGVLIQIEPGQDGTPTAEKFLLDAGLASQIRPYRARPCAMKHTTESIARAFRADAITAQRRLRSAFLGNGPISGAVADWIEDRVQTASVSRMQQKKVLLWIRDGAHHPGRNTEYLELLELTRRVQGAGLTPIWIGDALRDGSIPDGVIDMILFWKDPIFRTVDMRRSQLQFFEYLIQRHGLLGQVGVTTAGMDGPALMGLRTLYLTQAPNPRMGEWVGAVPGYREVVREAGYLEKISQELSVWSLRSGEQA